MYESKQAGISFDGIIIVKDNFWRDFQVPDDSELTFEVEMRWNSQETNYVTELDTSLVLKYEEKEVLRSKTSFVGFFSIDENAEDIDMETFIKNDSPAYIFPFIREHIVTVTRKSGVSAVLLPPMDILEVIKKGEIKI